MIEIEVRVCGIPAIARVTSYEPARDNRRGHIDDWLPDDPEEIEYEICDRRGRPATWLALKISDEVHEEIISQISKKIGERA